MPVTIRAWGLVCLYEGNNQQRIDAIKKSSDQIAREPVASIVADIASHLPVAARGALNDATVVPMPRSKPEKAIDPAFANAVARHATDARISVCLRRKSPVEESRNIRVTVAEHIDSMDVSLSLPKTPKIVLVDDVVTKGSSACAAATVLRNHGYSGEIFLIAASYTPLNAWDRSVRGLALLAKWNGESSFGSTYRV